MNEFAELAKGFGSAAPVIGLLLFLFWDERKERRQLQQEITGLFRSKLASDTLTTAVLEKIADKVGA